MIQSVEGKQPDKHKEAYVHPYAMVIGDVTLKESASVWPGAVVRGDCARIEIGKRSNIQDGCLLHTSHLPLIIGDNVTVGHGAILHSCDIGNGALIDMGAIVLDAVKIGENCIVAAGTVIPSGKVIEAGSVVMGNPFRVVRQVTDDEIKRHMEKITRYVALSKSYIKTGVLR